MKQRTLITTKSIFIITIIVIILTIIAVWLVNIGYHNSLFENSIISTSILSLSFFLFISTGLYKGYKLKDNIGKITNNITFKRKKWRSADSDSDSSPDIFSSAEGCSDIFEGILLWIIISIVIVVILYFIGPLLWAMVLAFAGMLYWIFFRALRLVFKNSNKCCGELWKSMLYGIGYTLLYNFWIYGIIMGLHYIKTLY